MGVDGVWVYDGGGGGGVVVVRRRGDGGLGFGMT